MFGLELVLVSNLNGATANAAVCAVAVIAKKPTASNAIILFSFDFITKVYHSYTNQDLVESIGIFLKKEV
jgi:hypothetical protein